MPCPEGRPAQRWHRECPPPGDPAQAPLGHRCDTAPKRQQSLENRSLLPARIPLLAPAPSSAPGSPGGHRAGGGGGIAPGFVPSGDSRPCPCLSWHSKFSSAGPVPGPGFVWQRSRIGSVVSPGQSPALRGLFPAECLCFTPLPPAPRRPGRDASPARSPRLLSQGGHTGALKGVAGVSVGVETPSIPHCHLIHERDPRGATGPAAPA